MTHACCSHACCSFNYSAIRQCWLCLLSGCLTSTFQLFNNSLATLTTCVFSYLVFFLLSLQVHMLQAALQIKDHPLTAVLNLALTLLICLLCMPPSCLPTSLSPGPPSPFTQVSQEGFTTDTTYWIIKCKGPQRELLLTMHTTPHHAAS